MDQLASLPETDRQLALQRFRVLQPHLEGGRTLREVARDAGVPYRTAQRWASLYRQFGLAALARRPGADRGKRRRLSDRMRHVVEGLALQKPPLPITTLYRQVARIAREQGEPEPSYAVVYDVVRGLPADLVMLAHEGGKAYGDVYELVHRREADRPNAIWQADHTPLDIELVRDDGTPARPWLTAVIDDYSRAIAGYFLSFEDPCAIQTALALRQAIWRKADARWHVCGIPDVLYTDNGPDFTSLHLEQVAADCVLVIATGLAALKRPTELGASALWALLQGSLLVAILGAVLRRGRRQAFWIGFAVCGVGYLAFDSTGWAGRPLFVTEYLIVITKRYLDYCA